EQSGTRNARPELLDALAQANRKYQERFGYIFIVCAPGKSTEEMLALLEQRLHNAPAAEIRIAAEEQSKITRLRLEKLLRGE
ncbi:MAG TPA: 2-oxo-4-hydroxy-4-carboxy-5-ureidoimidazoline decarboxylase, partial [Candidatus Limnocylindria bacterium]|nr:2-oxo-4-hydroxy-4-carboxy-5-ureidoimidazoline decarboxylase [Candidatus Limnocylindria bacterium]